MNVKLDSFDNKELVQQYDSIFSAGLGPLGDLLCDMPFDSKIMDFGCGTGRGLRFLSDHGFIDLQGVEQSQVMINQVRKFPFRTSTPLYHASFFQYLDQYGQQVFDLGLFLFSFHLITEGWSQLERVVQSLRSIARYVAIVTVDSTKLEDTTIIRLFPKLIRMENIIPSCGIKECFSEHNFVLDRNIHASYDLSISRQQFIKMLRLRFVSPMNHLSDMEITRMIQHIEFDPTPFHMKEHYEYLLFRRQDCV